MHVKLSDCHISTNNYVGSGIPQRNWVYLFLETWWACRCRVLPFIQVIKHNTTYPEGLGKDEQRQHLDSYVSPMQGASLLQIFFGTQRAHWWVFASKSLTLPPALPRAQGVIYDFPFKEKGRLCYQLGRNPDYKQLQSIEFRTSSTVEFATTRSIRQTLSKS